MKLCRSEKPHRMGGGSEKSKTTKIQPMKNKIIMFNGMKIRQYNDKKIKKL
jgi:hypothetical protein